VPAPMTETPIRPLILLVDDDPIVRLTLARALTDQGYDTRTAADGQVAIMILEGLRTLPAIAITDLQMRGGSGEELARTLTRRYPELPVIFMTAYLARYRAAYLPGPILEKPFHADQLAELVRSVLTAVSSLRGEGNTAGDSPGQRRQPSASGPGSATVEADLCESPEWPARGEAKVS
jgi:CheY-like chemotaxis protein